MKKGLLVLILCAIVISCTKENEDFYGYTFSTNAQINLQDFDNGYMKYTTVVDGTNLVFEYEFVRADEEAIADDEYSEYIRFEIDPNLNEFMYSGEEELTAINAFFTESCFCGYLLDEAKDVPPTGTISGKKISDTKWDISIDVIFYGDESKNISNTFQLKE